MDDERDPLLSFGGAVLRQERLRRRLNLLDVGERTRIHPRILDAIETDDIRSLPAPVYTVGLITSYARFLGVDPAPIVAAYRARLSRSDGGSRASRPQGRRRTLAVPGIVLPSVIVGLVVVLGIYLYQQYALYATDTALLRARPVAAAAIPPTPRSDADVPVEPPPPTAVPTVPPLPAAAAPVAVVQAAPVAPTIPRPTATPVPPPTATVTPVRQVKIDAKASARVWVQTEADSKVIFSGILNPGDQRTWIAQQTLLVWAGNGGSVTVTFNGKPLGTLGRPGEVVKVTWTAAP